MKLDISLWDVDSTRISVNVKGLLKVNRINRQWSFETKVELRNLIYNYFSANKELYD